MTAGISSPSMVTPSRSFQSFPRSQDAVNSSPPSIRTPPLNRPSLSPSDSYCNASATSSSGSGSPSGGPIAPPSTTVGSTKCETKQHYQRPSTLHGLKHKLHSSGCTKSLHGATGGTSSGGGTSGGVPGRRKSVGHIPLSPLARTPSPSPLPASPTRSPSPLAFPTSIGHQPGSSNTTQSYSPGSTSGGSGGGGGGTAVGSGCGGGATIVGATPVVSSAAGAGPPAKKGFVRPKGSEPGSPLLRRALSPDRLHPRSAETKCVLISPLAAHHQPVKGGVRGSAGSGTVVWRPSSGSASTAQAQQQHQQQMLPSDQRISDDVASVQHQQAAGVEPVVEQAQHQQPPPPSNRLSLTLAGPGELLPRIAEEKDSPTNNQEGKPTK